MPKDIRANNNEKNMQYTAKNNEKTMGKRYNQYSEDRKQNKENLSDANLALVSEESCFLNSISEEYENNDKKNVKRELSPRNNGCITFKTPEINRTNGIVRLKGLQNNHKYEEQNLFVPIRRQISNSEYSQKRRYNNSYFHGNGESDSEDDKYFSEEDHEGDRMEILDFEPNDIYTIDSNQEETLSTFELLVKPSRTRKRNRTIMTGKQSSVLKNFFKKNPFPNTSMREELGRLLDMRPRTVQIWFQNMRQKNKSKIENDIKNQKFKVQYVDPSGKENKSGLRDVSLSRIRPSNERSEDHTKKEMFESRNDDNEQNYKKKTSESYKKDSDNWTRTVKMIPEKSLKKQKIDNFSERKNEERRILIPPDPYDDQFTPELLDLRGLNALAEIAEGLLDKQKRPETQR